MPLRSSFSPIAAIGLRVFRRAPGFAAVETASVKSAESNEKAALQADLAPIDLRGSSRVPPRLLGKPLPVIFRANQVRPLPGGMHKAR